MMKYIVCAILLLAVSLASQEIDKKEICLIGCKLLKKDWQRELCEIACNQIKSDSEFEMKKMLKKMGKKAYEIAHQMRILSESESFLSYQTTTTVNVRTGPCTTYGVVTTLNSGATVTYQGSTQSGCGYDWRKVSGSFGTGYIAANYLREISEPSGQRINERGLSLIKSMEGFRSCRYICPAGYPTIGYGHVIVAGESFGCLSEPEAADLLRRDLGKFESCVKNNVRVGLNSNQFSALVSFSYNVGCGALQESTLLRLLNGGDYSSVCDQLKRWVYGGGQVLPGLVNRRNQECALFNA